MSKFLKVTKVAVLNENGLISNYSLDKAMIIEPNGLKSGDTLISNTMTIENVYSFYNKNCYMTDKGLVDAYCLGSKSSVCKKLEDLFSLIAVGPFVDFNAIKINHLNGNNGLDYTIEHCENILGHNFELKRTKWDISEYKKLYNALFFESEFIGVVIVKEFVKKVLTVANGCLYVEGLLSEMNNASFPSSYERVSTDSLGQLKKTKVISSETISNEIQSLTKIQLPQMERKLKFGM